MMRTKVVKKISFFKLAGFIDYIDGVYSRILNWPFFLNTETEN